MMGGEVNPVAMPSATQPAESNEARRKRIAQALLGTQALPAGHSLIAGQSAEATAYHLLNPYPWWHFKEWKIDERGPYPRCVPFGKSIVIRSARWLFGKPIQLNCADNPDLQTFFRNAWTENRMRSRMRAAAEKGGIQGGIVLKFSYDATAMDRKLRFQILSSVDECRLFYDPHDRECLLMARVQYPYLDNVSGKWMMYREEWTDQTFRKYKPVEAITIDQNVNGFKYPTMMVVVADGKEQPDLYGKWEVEREEANPFGLIPLQPIRNIDVDDVYGVGDLWGLYRVWDRVNLTYHLMDKSNQFDSEPNLIYQDLEVPQSEADKPLAPGQGLSLKSDLDDEDNPVKTGKAYLLESKGNLRPAMMEYAKDFRQQILVAASSVDVDQADFTNKGNLTEAVMLQLYGPLIEITDEKRENYGENGICQFLEKCALGLQNLTNGPTIGKIAEISTVKADNEETYDMQIVWPPYFQLSQDEMAAVVGRTQEEEIAGYLTRERAVKRIAKLEGVDDIEALETELEAEAKQKAADALAIVKASATATDPKAAPGVDPVQAASQQIRTLRSLGGPDSK